MKEYGWSLGDSMKYVKARRNVVQPNAGFWKQLITYEGILNSRYILDTCMYRQCGCMDFTFQGFKSIAFVVVMLTVFVFPR